MRTLFCITHYKVTLKTRRLQQKKIRLIFCHLDSRLLRQQVFTCQKQRYDEATTKKWWLLTSHISSILTWMNSFYEKIETQNCRKLQAPWWVSDVKGRWLGTVYEQWFFLGRHYNSLTAQSKSPQHANNILSSLTTTTTNIGSDGRSTGLSED